MKNENSYEKNWVVVLATFMVIMPMMQLSKAYSTEGANGEKALEFLTNVIGLDTASYNVTLASKTPLGDSQEIIKYRLESAVSTLEALCYFKNNILYNCFLHEYEGSLVFAQPSTDTLDYAKDTLARYQSYLNASYLQPISILLDTVTKIQPMTTTSGDVKFTITIDGGSKTMEWMRAVNGVYNDYNRICMRFYKGSLEQFSDTWNLYQSGGAEVKVTREEAIKIAMDAMRNYSYNVGDIVVSNFTVVDSTPPSAELSMQLREDGLLYPLWDVYLYLDKMYPGMVTTLRAILWADTGEVSIQAISGGGSPVDGNPSPSTSGTSGGMQSTAIITLVAAVVISVSAVSAGLIITKKRRNK